MLKANARVVLLGSLLAAALAAALATAAPTLASTPRNVRVKLFDAGKQVGEWTSEGPVRNEGAVLVFTTRQGVVTREVRIHGTYSAEAVE
jgi:hypothetical protein